jgi:hypothetical protein
VVTETRLPSSSCRKATFRSIYGNYLVRVRQRNSSTHVALSYSLACCRGGPGVSFSMSLGVQVASWAAKRDALGWAALIVAATAALAVGLAVVFVGLMALSGLR